MKKETSKYFELFKKECWYWINKWELNNNTYRFFNGLKKEDKEKYESGVIHRTLINCQCDIYFDNKIKDTIEIKKTAKHEIIHALLFKLYFLGRNRQFTWDEFDREEEELAHKLEKLLL